MSKTIILAEKPSVARNIAAVLGRPVRKEGYLEVDNYIITWALGHLVELAEPEDYDPVLKKWSLDTLPIIPERFFIKPSKNKKTSAHFKLLKRLLNRKDVKVVINACDAAREGELIFRYIYYLACCTKPFKRLWLSENTPAAVHKAINNLLDGSATDLLAAAAIARSQADWLVGINATRAFTKLQKSFYSVGRVQTPALALLVNREREIRAFVPQVYYELWGIFIIPNGETYKGRWFKDDNYIFSDTRQAEKVKRQVAHKTGNIISIEYNDLVQPAPALYNLNDLQRDANTRYGFPAYHTMELAQSLYEKRLLTYPRTESRHLTQLMVETLPERLDALAVNKNYRLLINSDSFGEIAAGSVNDNKVSDHHAIIPTGVSPDFSRLSDGEQLMYDLVARRFLANFFPPALDEKKTVITAVGEHTFFSTAKTEKDPGWRVVYAGFDSKLTDNEEKLPKLQPGVEVQVSDAQVIEKKTKPPSRFTDASLLAVLEDIGRLIPDGEMKKMIKQAGGLGTSATRSAIIERLIQVGYVRREGKKLIPTEKGESLIDIVPDEIKSPELTVRWEGYLKKIEQGNIGADKFISDIKDLVARIVEKVTTESLRA